MTFSNDLENKVFCDSKNLQMKIEGGEHVTSNSYIEKCKLKGHIAFQRNKEVF